MIQYHINSIRNYGVLLKLERFSHLSGLSFGFGTPIGLEYLSQNMTYRTSVGIVLEDCKELMKTIPTSSIVHVKRSVNQAVQVLAKAMGSKGMGS